MQEDEFRGQSEFPSVSSVRPCEHACRGAASCQGQVAGQYWACHAPNRRPLRSCCAWVPKVLSGRGTSPLFSLLDTTSNVQSKRAQPT